MQRENSSGSAATGKSSGYVRSLGRAVSTGYYALFHLLLYDAARRGRERAFDHGPMKTISLQFRGTTWQDWVGTSRHVPPAVRSVASAFVDLQEELLHTADYDNHEQWIVTEVQATLKTAQTAFQDWQSIRADPMAGNYLFAMLLRKPR